MENSNQQRSKSTVFLSYAREDKEFVRVLKAALEERGVETKGDWELTTGEDYAMRLRGPVEEVMVGDFSEDLLQHLARR